MQKNIVEKTSEVSLHIFKEALKMAEFTLPPSSVEALWYSADKAQMAGNKAQERASLRQVKDLEDRLVMYLSNGMFYEALRNLIVNELHVPSLHVLDGKEIKAAFKQVDEKTGCCGIIDPHEVSELLLLLSQEGMDLSVVLHSFDQLRLHLDPEAVQDAFMMVDTNCDDKIDLTEFLSLIDRLVEDVLPDAIFEYMGLQRHQIFWGVILKVMTILTMFLFVFVSLNAFHVDVGEKAASAGSSSIRAALAGLALLGLRSDMSPEYMEKQANIAK
ncbi:EF-hand domain-containing protein, partial [Durusdinium trenchii]